MALIRTIKRAALEKDSPHRNADCTYSVVTRGDGARFLQLDTYGSSERKFKGKKSQSIRLTEAAVAELREIISHHFR